MRETTGNSEIIWQQVAKSAVVFISGDANIENIMPILQNDFAFLPASVVVRVPKLPMNALVEVEILANYLPLANSETP